MKKPLIIHYNKSVNKCAANRKLTDEVFPYEHIKWDKVLAESFDIDEICSFTNDLNYYHTSRRLFETIVPGVLWFVPAATKFQLDIENIKTKVSHHIGDFIYDILACYRSLYLCQDTITTFEKAASEICRISTELLPKGETSAGDFFLLLEPHLTAYLNSLDALLSLVEIKFTARRKYFHVPGRHANQTEEKYYIAFALDEVDFLKKLYLHNWTDNELNDAVNLMLSKGHKKSHEKQNRRYIDEHIELRNHVRRFKNHNRKFLYKRPDTSIDVQRDCLDYSK